MNKKFYAGGTRNGIRFYTRPAVGSMSDDEFDVLRGFINKNIGIKMPPEKKILLESRIAKRMRELDIPSYGDYIKFAFGDKNTAEIVEMLNVVTTNKTDFFREPGHFGFLKEIVLPHWSQRLLNKSRPLFLWSAGCSTGEEPYTIAMVVDDYFSTSHHMAYRINATDISTTVLDTARKGIYARERTAPVSKDFLKRYMLRSKDREVKRTRIKPGLRDKIDFHRFNLKEFHKYPSHKYHIVFCRNVIIYFDKHDQEKVLNGLCNSLVPGGFLFLGHSETLSGLKMPLTNVSPTVYRKEEV